MGITGMGSTGLDSTELGSTGLGSTGLDLGLGPFGFGSTTGIDSLLVQLGSLVLHLGN